MISAPLARAPGRARNFPIDELYIPLTTAAITAERLYPGIAAERTRVPLEEVLKDRRLVIVGDPGSSKTTSLRRIAFKMAKEPSRALRPRAPPKPMFSN